MSAFTPAGQILARHESTFVGKRILVAGDIHDDSILQLPAEDIKVHCSQFHVYLMLLSRKQKAQIEFGVFPSASFYTDVDTLIYFWPKSKVEAQFQLSLLLSSLPQGVDVFIVGENRSGVNSAQTLLNPFGSIQKRDSARRCSLYYFQAQSHLSFDFNQWWSQYHLQIANIDLAIHSLPSVFSQKMLDTGSRLLLDALNDHADIVKGRVLDMGCGCGVLSAFIGKLNSNIELVATDVNAMALLATTRTLQLNAVEAEIKASDVFSHVDDKFDLIISNPPFHNGRETDYSVVDKLIVQCRNYLTSDNKIGGGKLCIVANSFLPYHRILTQHFKRVDVIAQTTKFKVYLAS